MTTQIETSSVTRKNPISPNLLDPQIATAGNSSESATKFRSLLSATISYTTDEHYKGKGCIKVVTPGVQVNEGTDHASYPSTVVSGETYTCWLVAKAPAGAKLRFTAGGGLTGQNFTMTGAWDVLKITGTATSTSVCYILRTNESTQAITYYCGPAILRKGTY